MLYLQNASFGQEGFNTHLMSYTFAVSLSNFLGRDFFFDYEIPCSTPPDYASKDEYKDKFGVLLTAKRSLVTDLVKIPNRRVFEVDREVANKAEYQMLYSYFATTEAMQEKFEGTFVWDAFGIGRFSLTREDLQKYDLIEWTHAKTTSPAVFYFLPRAEKQALLDSVKIRFTDEIERLAAKIIADAGAYNAVHLRLGDFLTNYAADEYSVNVDRFTKYIRATFPDDTVPIMVATDGLQEKELFAKMFAGYKLIFIDELIFDEYRDEYNALEFADFNVVTVLNELICGAADMFIGTYRSTFTGIIHRLRQERYGKTDFNFFPDEKVARLLNDGMKLVPDSMGFFDWNRYSVMSTGHLDISWMREWDHSRTMIDV
ncbi:MAG TPA: O-fucosyltransferase family protein [Pyrinomonadaceae bacterium]|nr:O-fucosyltransferase family protein [Pyrinomonadaceae bacterium]